MRPDIPATIEQGAHVADIIADRYVVDESQDTRSGAHSAVKKVYDMRESSVRAIKLIIPPNDEMASMIFRREVESLQKAAHENVVEIYDFGQDDGTPFIVLPWIEETYDDVLRSRRQGTANDVVYDVILPLVRALGNMHEKSIEHRDIKPANILMHADGRPLLADFSLGKPVRDARGETATGHTMRFWRTEIFSPPEKADERRFVRDVFSIGALFAASVANVEITEYHQLKQVILESKIATGFKGLFSSCVSIIPADRPENGSILLVELEALLQLENDQAKRSPKLWFELTPSCSRAISEGDGSKTPEQVLEEDLASGFRISFENSAETGMREASTFKIVGDRLLITAKIDYNTAVLKVVYARWGDFETLEWARRAGHDLSTGLKIQMGRPVSIAVAKREIAEAVSMLASVYEKAEATAYEADAKALLSVWRRQLEAREELAKGGRRAVDFSNATVSNEEIEVELAEDIDADVLFSEWEVRETGESRYGPRVEVVSQSARKLRLKWRTGGTLPRKGRGILVPNIGPEQIALKRQREAIRTLEQDTQSDSGLLSKLVDPRTATSPAQVDVARWHSLIDPDKQSVVKAALGLSDIMLVTGPPGTGKTRLIGEIVAQVLDAAPTTRILVVSQTHIALDNALERISELGVSEIVRLGKPNDPRVASSVRGFLLEERMLAWSLKLRENAQAYTAKLAAEKDIDAADLRIALDIEQLISAIEEQRQIDLKVERAGNEAGAHDLTIDPTAELDSTDLQKKVDLLAKEITSLSERVRDSLHGRIDLSVAPNVNELRAAVELLLNDSPDAKELLDIVGLQADWLQRVFSDDSLAETYLQTASVVAGTCIGFLGHPAARDLEFDLCIFDEASKATITEALVPISRATRSILVGDENQLPPMDEDLLRRPDILKNYGLETSEVTQTLFGRLLEHLPEQSKFLLRDQYRMVPAIGDLVSELFYDGKLRSMTTQRLTGYEILASPVMWVDTSSAGGERREKFDAVSKSFLNRHEAKMVVLYLERLDLAISKGLVVPPNSKTQLDVLLIAPYKSQIETIRRAMAEWNPDHLDITIESIDAVQGRESDVVVFSVTRSNPEGKTGFLNADHWRRINVALSRARFALTIIGDANFAGATTSVLSRVVDYIERNPETCQRRSNHG